MRRLFLPFLCWLMFAIGAWAQAFSLPQGMNRPLDVDKAFAMQVQQTEDGAVLHWTIAPGYYLYRDHLQAETVAGDVLALETEPGTVKDDPNFGTMEVYYNNAEARLKGGGDVTVTFQGCQEDGICYPPVQKDLTLTSTAPALTADAPSSGMKLATGPGVIEGLSQQGGALWVLAGFFGFGLLLAFTPCVFPMLPILAGMLARQGGELSMRKGVGLSGAYVFAMALAFGAMGAVAGWSGQNLQMVLQSPWAVGAVAVLFVALALSSFGLFELTLPSALTDRLNRIGGTGGSIGSALLLGFTSALIVGPCVTAPLAGALLYIAQTGDVVLGAAALFALGLGQGVPLLIIGAFGSRVLPKAGPWMEVVRAVFGIAFLSMAVWLASRVFPGPATLAMWAVLAIGVAVFLGALDRIPQTAGAVARLSRTAGVILLLWGGTLAIGAAAGGSDPLRPLAGLRGGAGPAAPVEDIAQINTMTELNATKGPALIYVTADWCVYCRGIDRNVLPDPQVKAVLAGTALYKIDVTDLNDEAQAMLDTLGAAGPPTMVFLNAHQKEAEGSRLIGDVSTGDVIRSVKLIGGGA